MKVRAGTPIVTTRSMTLKLQHVVLKAQEEGRVIEQLVQLQFSEAKPTITTHIEGLPQEPPEPLSAFEQQYLTALDSIPVSSNPDSAWCMLRTGYAEHEHPSHLGIVIDGKHRRTLGFLFVQCLGTRGA